MSEETATMEPPAKKQRIEDHASQVPQSVEPVDDFSKDVEVDGEDRGFSVNEDKYTNYVTQEELERLREFHVLDEVKSDDEDSHEDDSESSDGKSEGLPEEEIEKMLEEDLPDDFKGAPKPKEKPYITRQKVVLEEKGVNHFEVLPLDWMVARHYSGMPIYMHRATRVCTLSKPYFLGKGNTRRHDIPISAIPCLAYRKALEEERKQKEIDKQIEEQIKSGTWKNNIGKENSENNASKDVADKHKSNINQSSEKTDDSVFKCPVSGNTADEKLAKESIDVNSKCPYKRGFLTKDSETSKNSKEKDEETSKSYSKNGSSVDSQDIPKIAQDFTNLDEGLEKVNENASPLGIVANEDATTELVNMEKTLENFNADSMNENDSSDKIKSTPDNAFTQEADETTRLNETNEEDPSNLQLGMNEIKNTGQVISNIDITATEKANKTNNTEDNKAHDPSNKEIGTELPPAYKESIDTETSKETPQDSKAEANKEAPLASNTETTNETAQAGNTDANKEAPLASNTEITNETAQAGNTDANKEAPIASNSETTDETAQAGNTDANKEVPLNMQPVVLPGGIVMPPPRVETVSTSWKTQHLTPEEVNEYCKSLFKFKTVNIMHFKRWADRRKYTKARKTLQYPTLPEGTKLITIPAQPSNGQENGGKATKRDWVMNMNGRSYLSVFHEYVRRALQKQPVYEFRQLENASTPYQATVYIGGMQYGVGRGSSKRAAKSAAARASIHILIPEMRRELDAAPAPGAGAAEPEPDFSFFDYVGIEDPRITEFCAATCEPSPHAILRTCLLRNFGAGDRHIHTEMKKLEYQKIELTMKVGKHSATVVCKNKKTAKQRASQAILQALHPHVRSWGSLLRLYGSRSVKSCKEKKLEEQQITLLQDAAKHNEPNYAVLEKLRNEMRKLRERDEAVVPIGTLLVKDDLPTHSGSNLNNVDL